MVNRLSDSTSPYLLQHAENPVDWWEWSEAAFDEAQHGVRANCVNPGWVRTEMADAEMAEFGAPLGISPDHAYAAVTSLVPQGRPAEPDEIAGAVMWLIGPDSTYVNGAGITVDGGTTIVDPGSVPFHFDVRRRG